MSFPITSRFMESESFRGGSPHRGIDLAMPDHTPLRSIQNGIVERVADFQQFSGGKMLFIKWEDGKTAVYGHLSEFTVKKGDAVHVGDLIAYSGNSGNVVGANGGYHLHFAVKEGSKFIDPSPYIQDIQNMNNLKQFCERVTEIVQTKVDFFQFMSRHTNSVGETLTNLKLQIVHGLSYDVLFIQILKQLDKFFSAQTSFLHFIIAHIF